MPNTAKDEPQDDEEEWEESDDVPADTPLQDPVPESRSAPNVQADGDDQDMAPANAEEDEAFDDEWEDQPGASHPEPRDDGLAAPGEEADEQGATQAYFEDEWDENQEEEWWEEGEEEEWEEDEEEVEQVDQVEEEGFEAAEEHVEPREEEEGEEEAEEMVEEEEDWEETESAVEQLAQEEEEWEENEDAQEDIVEDEDGEENEDAGAEEPKGGATAMDVQQQEGQPKPAEEQITRRWRGRGREQEENTAVVPAGDVPGSRLQNGQVEFLASRDAIQERQLDNAAPVDIADAQRRPIKQSQQNGGGIPARRTVGFALDENEERTFMPSTSQSSSGRTGPQQNVKQPPSQSASSSSKMAPSRPDAGRELPKPTPPARLDVDAGPQHPKTSGGSSAEREQSPSAASDLRQRVKQLEQENRALRLELGQERFKVKQLGHLRDEMAASQRQEMLAKKSEARAMKELQEMKVHMERRAEFAQCEKGELLVQIQKMEREAAEINARELGFRTELKEALYYRDNAASQIGEAKKETDRWRKEALDQTARAKNAENKVHQLEQRRAEEKAAKAALAASNAVSNPNEAGLVKEECIPRAAPKKAAGVKKAAGPLKNGAASGAMSDWSANLVSVARSLTQYLFAAQVDDTATERAKDKENNLAGSRRRKEAHVAGHKGKGVKAVERTADGDVDMSAVDALVGQAQKSFHQHVVLGMLIVWIAMLALYKLSA